MKRTYRDLAVITKEREEAGARYQSLCDETDKHPLSVKTRRQTQMQRLKSFLPDEEVYEALANDLSLWRCEYSLQAELTADKERAHRVWSFQAFFADEVHDFDCDYSLDLDDGDGEFTEVPFVAQQRPLRLWGEAKRRNPDSAGQALAAFCFACCVVLDDYDDVTGTPAVAFRSLCNKRLVEYRES